MEKILSITETTFQNGRWNSNYDGYVIQTDKQEIKVGISNGQSCCEDWGYLMSNDDLNDFIGAELISLNTTDEQLSTVNFDTEDHWSSETAAMFVTFITSNGPLQFIAYNTHNGYYGHDAVLVSNQLNHEETL